MRTSHHLARSLLALTVPALLAAPLAAPSRAGAQVPGLTATFIDPTGTGTPITPFEVWVRLTLDPSAPAFQFDGTAGGAIFGSAFGLPPASLPILGSCGFLCGSDLFATYTSAVTAAGVSECTDTFWGCGVFGRPYDFVPNTGGGGQPTFDGLTSFTLLPGQSFDFLLGTLVPIGGSAPAGTYAFTDARLTARISGFSAGGGPFGGPAPKALTGSAFIAQTCLVPAPGGCGFTRTVVGPTAAPEPVTVALLATGLIGLAGAHWRRRS